MENRMSLFILDNKGKTKRLAEKVECVICKTPFLKRIGGKQKCCSVACGQKIKCKKIELECFNCKSKIFKSPSKMKNSKHGFYFCSRGCKEKSQSLRGNCKEIRPTHYGTYLKTIKKSSITDNPFCVDCKIDKKYILMVHHIDGVNSNNPVDGSNWEIVCANCHIKRHLKKNKNNEWIYDTKVLTPRELLNEL